MAPPERKPRPAKKKSRRRKRVLPALLTGTSTEFLGRRPLPRVVRERRTAMLLGPSRVGKTSVALRLATMDHRDPAGATYLDTLQLQGALLARVREGAWSASMLERPSLVLDGPVWLQNRPGAVAMYVELLAARARAGRRTFVVQSDDDGSIQELIGAMGAGAIVVIGLRFPEGRRGRMRFARRICVDLGLPEAAAIGTAQLDPWGYDSVLAHLRGWALEHGALDSEAM